MVNAINKPFNDASAINVPQDELNWSSICLSEVSKRDNRLEASVFDIEGRHAHEVVNRSKWEVVNICGDKGLATAYHRPRFKRIWVDISSYPIYQPAKITEVYPKPSGYISDKTDTDIEALRVKKGQILLTCSGTIGKCTVVTDTLNNKIFSHDLIRINCNDDVDIGYIYAFLKSKIGDTLINTNNYGAVISHIEPEHLNNVPIPNPPRMIKHKINELIMDSFALRDKSNSLLDEAELLLLNELNLPVFETFKYNCLDNNIDLNYYATNLSDLNNRLDASYHNILARMLLSHFKQHAKNILSVGNCQISKQIVLAGIFKRIYVGEGHGVPFIGGKEILQLSPEPTKYLATKHHKDRIEKELKVEKNMILITDRGTIGNVAFVPKHFEGFAVSQNVIKVKAVNDEIAGYLFVYLRSSYGNLLIKRQTYGSVVDMIDDKSVAQIEIPLLQPNATIEINNLALESNELCYKAYLLEQQALTLINREVLKTELDSE